MRAKLSKLAESTGWSVHAFYETGHKRLAGYDWRRSDYESEPFGYSVSIDGPADDGTYRASVKVMWRVPRPTPSGGTMLVSRATQETTLAGTTPNDLVVRVNALIQAAEREWLPAVQAAHAVRERLRA